MADLVVGLSLVYCDMSQSRTASAATYPEFIASKPPSSLYCCHRSVPSKCGGGKES
jgi:hypothetical protein